MSKICTHAGSKNPWFWDHASAYASKVDRDRSFVDEMAYMIVTLHRTGA